MLSSVVSSILIFIIPGAGVTLGSARLVLIKHDGTKYHSKLLSYTHPYHSMARTNITVRFLLYSEIFHVQITCLFVEITQHFHKEGVTLD